MQIYCLFMGPESMTYALAIFQTLYKTLLTSEAHLRYVNVFEIVCGSWVV